jgi:hypothetical protein
MMKAVIDRFEGDIAVLQLEDGEEILWPVKHLPPGSAEGNVLALELTLDTEAEKDLRRSIKDIQGRLKKRT